MILTFQICNILHFQYMVLLNVINTSFFLNQCNERWKNSSKNAIFKIFKYILTNLETRQIEVRLMNSERKKNMDIHIIIRFMKFKKIDEYKTFSYLL